MHDVIYPPREKTYPAAPRYKHPQARGRYAQHTKHLLNMTFEGITAKQAECISACNDCYTACVICIKQHAGEKMMADCIRACLDCLATCRACSHLDATGSRLGHQARQLCAEACQACYDTCSQMDNPYCKQCAEACKRCMEACRAMAA